MLRPEHETPLGPCIDSPSPELLKELWGEVVARTRELGAPIDDHLAPGLSEREIRAELADIGMEPNPELVALFECQNGPSNGKPTPSVDAFPGYFPLSLRWAIKRYRDEPLGVGYDELQWDPRWLAVLGWQQTIAVRNVVGDASPPLVRSVLAGILQGDLDEYEPDTQVLSLCTVLAWKLDLFAAGAYRWDGLRVLRDFPMIPTDHRRRLLLV